MSKRFVLHFVICAAFLGISPLLAAPGSLELAAPYTDHMILQRDKPVAVWGLAAPGDHITVEFAGQKKSTTADARGDWWLKLDPLPASAEGREFKVTKPSAPAESLTLTDVLVGEVWFPSGQSNMVWVANKSACAGLAKELAASDPEVPIREINMNEVFRTIRQARLPSASSTGVAEESP